MHSSATPDTAIASKAKHESDEEIIERVKHGILISLVLLKSCASVNASLVAVHVNNIRLLIDNILNTSTTLRHSIIKESDMLEMLQEVSFVCLFVVVVICSPHLTPPFTNILLCLLYHGRTITYHPQ
jgi:hypothetical protein